MLYLDHDVIFDMFFKEDILSQEGLGLIPGHVKADFKAGTVLVLFKLTKYAVSVWFHCSSGYLTFCLYFIIFCDI